MSVPKYKQKTSTMEFIRLARDLDKWGLMKYQKLSFKHGKVFDEIMRQPISRIDKLVNLANNTKLDKYYEERTTYFNRALTEVKTVSTQFSLLIEVFPELFSKAERSDISSSLFNLKKSIEGIIKTDKKRYDNLQYKF